MEVIEIKNIKEFEDKVSTEILINSFNVYCRVSTKDQIENTSLDNQKELGVEYVTKNHSQKFKYIIVWREEGKSGDDFLDDDDIGEMVKRELLSILIDSWKKRVIKNIWVYDLSRLSRNDDTSNLLKSIIYKNGIDLYLNNQKYNFDNKMDKLLFGVLSLVNEFENHQRFEKGLMGKRRNLDSGKWWGGSIPMGYKSDENGKLIEDEVRSKWVKKIYKWYSEGLSTQKISERLEKIGIKSQRGNTNWSTQQIRKILTHTSYIGYIDYEVKGLKGKSKEYCREKGLTHKHRFECPPIIDQKDYEYVRQLFSKRRRQPNSQNNKHQFLLKEILICSGCGNMMRGKYQPSKNTNVYRCVTNENNYRDKRIDKCENSKTIHRLGLEELIWVNILNIFGNSEIVKEEFRKKNLPKELNGDVIKKRIKENISKIKRRQTKIQTIHKKLEENTIKNITLKISDNMFENIKVSVEKEIEKIENEINQLEIQNDLWLNDNVWEDWFDSFKLHFNKICSYTKSEDKRKFITDYIENIYVGWDGDNNTHNIKINFKLNIVKDKGELVSNDIYKIKRGKKEIDINGINLRKFNNHINKKRDSKTYLLNYSTVTECSKMEVSNLNSNYNNKYNSLILDFTISIKTSKLTKTSHYTDYQQRLFEEIKRLKEVDGYGYRRISYILYEKGYRSIRTDSILKNNYIYSIYKKGKVREQRINREYETEVDDINVYQCF
jgi:DNA invertase Pin-like site-specific DNA recombinase